MNASHFSSTMTSQILAALSACPSAVTSSTPLDSSLSTLVSPLSTLVSPLSTLANLELNSASSDGELDPIFRCTVSTKDDFLLPPSLEEELFLELFRDPSLLRVAEDNRLMDPLEHSTSSEKETLEFLDDLREAEDDEDADDTEDLSDLIGTMTGASELQVAQLATLTRARRGVLEAGPGSGSQKLRRAIREWPASKSKYWRSVSRKRSR